jgi:hypothetical protein
MEKKILTVVLPRAKPEEKKDHRDLPPHLQVPVLRSLISRLFEEGRAPTSEEVDKYGLLS